MIPHRRSYLGRAARPVRPRDPAVAAVDHGPDDRTGDGHRRCHGGPRPTRHRPPGRYGTAGRSREHQRPARSRAHQPAADRDPDGARRHPGPTRHPESPVPVECPLGNPTARQPHPSDGRIHGGGLSFPKTADVSPTEQQPYFTWAYDVAGQDRPVEEQWELDLCRRRPAHLRRVRVAEQSAELVMDCTVSSGPVPGLQRTHRACPRPRSSSTSGRLGHPLRSACRPPPVSVAGDTLVVIVVDPGSPESLAMFWACVPIGDNAALKQLETVAGRSGSSSGWRLRPLAQMGLALRQAQGVRSGRTVARIVS